MDAAITSAIFSLIPTSSNTAQTTPGTSTTALLITTATLASTAFWTAGTIALKSGGSTIIPSTPIATRLSISVNILFISPSQNFHTLLQLYAASIIGDCA